MKTRALVVNNLKKVYPNNIVALKGIHLEVAEGDFFALLGQNGAGKSTTIGILSSLVNKTEGTVSIFGHDLDTDLQSAKDCIGVVPQEMNFNIFETIFQILINQAGYYGIPRKIAIQRAEFYLKKMGIWEKRNQAALRLSGGMKRRLLIARALMNNPKLLILDEPTAGVDIELRHTLWNFLRELNENGTTIILTTHYLEEAEHLCKNVAIIHQGTIIENDNMKLLLNRLHIQTFVLELKNPITELPQLEQFPLRKIDDITLEAKLQQHQTVNDLFTALSQHNIWISSIRHKTNRLEELFVNLVGSST